MGFLLLGIWPSIRTILITPSRCSDVEADFSCGSCETVEESKQKAYEDLSQIYPNQSFPQFTEMARFHGTRIAARGQWNTRKLNSIQPLRAVIISAMENMLNAGMDSAIIGHGTLLL